MRNDAFYRYSTTLAQLSTDREKILWLKGRINQVLIEPVEMMKRHWAEDTAIRCLNLGVMTLLCSGIEALSNFYTDVGDGGKRFRRFVERYMNTEFKSVDPYGKKYSSYLWDYFRCGLAHGFTIERGGILEYTDKYFRYDQTRGLGIDLWMFFEDFKRAFHQYIEDVKKTPKNSPLRTHFRNRFFALYKI